MERKRSLFSSEYDMLHREGGIWFEQTRISFFNEITNRTHHHGKFNSNRVNGVLLAKAGSWFEKKTWRTDCCQIFQRYSLSCSNAGSRHGVCCSIICSIRYSCLCCPRLAGSSEGNRTLVRCVIGGFAGHYKTK